MGRRTNKFIKAITQLKSTEIDDKLAVLEAAPTNSTMGYMSGGVHGLPKPDITVTTNSHPDLPVPDYTQDALSNGRDTTGLFNASGVHAEGTWIRTKEPPGDTSYVLGPMAAMYYTWSYPWTTIGYIRESDRKMVNLAKISGKLSDWDGVSNFSSSQYGGQLTLEQAVWFRDVKKLNNAGNDPDDANYRAFYPGPPSNTPDEHGRYHCVITGDPKNQDEDSEVPDPGKTEPDPLTGTPDEIFALIMDKLRKGKGLTEEEKQWLRDQGMDGFVDDLEGGNVAYDAISELIALGITFAAVKALLPTIIAAGRGALKYVKDWYNTGRNISVPNEGTARWRDLLKNDWDQIGKFSKGTGTWYPRNAAELRQVFTGEGGIIWSFTRGFHTAPTPAFRQAVERLFKMAFGGGKGLWKWHYEPQGELISESRRSAVLKNIKKPVVVPKEQKKFKVKPKLRTSSKYMGSTPKISKPVETPKEYKQVGGRNLWGKEEYNYNTRQSQERMNQVYELVGDGDHAFDYMLNDSKKLNDEQMEKFWGKNPDFYSYFYGGKKYKLVRKEEMDGDFLVFLVDDHGEKSNILQSELNEKLAEEQEKKELEEYNKMNSKEPVSVEKDYMFKKVQKRLKPQIDYKDKPAKKGYPNQPPPEMVNNRHPDFGKPPGSSYYNKLDPKSAEAMPQQDDPTIDAKVKDAKENPKKDSAMYRRKLDDKMKKEREKLNKEEWETSDWRKELESIV